MENKKRCANFSCSEERRLLDLVHKFKDKVENKRTDTDANRIKKEAWKEIEKRFNIAGSETYRNELILKRKYENIKKRTKSKFADEKRYCLGTGGGPAKSANITDTDEIIKEIIGDQLTGRSSKYDSDTMAEETEMESSIANLNAEINATLPLLEQTEEVTRRTPVINEAEPLTSKVCSNEKKSNHGDCSSYSADKLRTPKSVPLKRRAACGESLSKRLCSWAENKSEMEDLKKTLTIEEQRLRLEHMQEIHEVTVQQMKEKHEVYIEECRLSMKILREEHENKLQKKKLE